MKLTNCKEWADTYDNFSSSTLYDIGIDCFELVEGPTAKKHDQELSRWWGE